MTRSSPLYVRAARPGEGAAVSALWRELWNTHEGWGGYPGTRDPRVYAQLAARLDDDARLRTGHPFLGRHVHLVVDDGGAPCGQVEGWIDQLGAAPSTPATCEVRSLIVDPTARRRGAGRILLDGLAHVVRVRLHPAACVLAAEVLEPNPAQAFYLRLGYAPVAWTARIEADASPAPARDGTATARRAAPGDASALARLEASLAARRRAAGDLRFDRPRAVDATLVQAIAAQLAADEPAGLTRDRTVIVALDRAGVVRGTATFSVQQLEPPFLPVRRALLGRVAIDPAHPTGPLVAALMAFACELARSHGAGQMEITDLSAPGTELSRAALATGARPWSRVVARLA